MHLYFMQTAAVSLSGARSEATFLSNFSLQAETLSNWSPKNIPLFYTNWIEKINNKASAVRHAKSPLPSNFVYKLLKKGTFITFCPLNLINGGMLKSLHSSIVGGKADSLHEDGCSAAREILLMATRGMLYLGSLSEGVAGGEGKNEKSHVTAPLPRHRGTITTDQHVYFNTTPSYRLSRVRVSRGQRVRESGGQEFN